ncbi:MAG: DUF2384 domain-containing protein [Gammaproteobacteria bacterium]|nr:DUF2384 domain-containing protein [Gammaproteobacteria bacterium]
MVDQSPLPHPGPMSRTSEQPRVPAAGGHGDSPSERDAAPSSRDILSFLTSTARTVTFPVREDGDMVAMVRRGFPVAALDNLVAAVGVPQKEIARAVGIPATTLGRRRKNGHLTPMESDQVVRVARLAVMARAMMAGDTDAARRWLMTPHRLLGNETPLCRASTETGGREVEQLIGQLRHGVFS